MNIGYSRLVRKSSALLLALQLVACGVSDEGNTADTGSGDSDSGENTDSNSGSGTQTYSVGGTVTGADNGALTLENNGTDSLEVLGVSFEFPTELEDGSDYSVTVAQPPEHQLCSVDNASGKVSGASVDNIEVFCRAWRTADLLENSGDGDAEHPQIAVDPDGDAIAVWEQSDGSTLNIYANIFSSDTGTWRGRELIENDDTGDATSPQIAVDDDGNAIVVWQQSDGDAENIYANTYTKANGTWGTKEELETSTRDARDPQIAINGTGDAVAVWEQEQADATGHVNIYANTYSSGGGDWSTRTLLESGDYGDANSPQVAIDTDGNAIAVWRQYIHNGTKSTYCICANTYTAESDRWDAWEQIDSIDGSAQIPQIAMDDAGNAVAVWRQDDVEGGVQFSIYANRYSTDSAAWGEPALIETIDDEADNPQVALDSQGNAIAVWSQDQGDDLDTIIYSNTYSVSGDSWDTTATPIEAGDTGTAYRPQIDFDGDGNAIATWYQSDGTYFSVYANTYSADAGDWGERELIENSTGYAFGAQIDVNQAGDAIAVWDQDDGTQDSIYGNRFE